jgi:PadR family transcriptional regulator PadR
MPPRPRRLFAMSGSNLYTGTLDLLILKAVSWGPSHGYAIGRWIRETTEDVLVVQEGVLYPALHRLERRGLLKEEWRRTETGRDAKFYSLTGAGRRELRAEVSRWLEHTRAVNRALAVST